MNALDAKRCDRVLEPASSRGSRVAELVWAFLRGLRSWQLFVLAATLFAGDLVTPDPVPFLDEILLGVVTLLLARWKARPGIGPPND